MNIQAVVTDIDDTLLGDRKEMPAVNAVALKRVASRGIPVVLASGRMTPCIEPFYDRIGIDGPVMAYNGALLRTTRGEGRKTLYHQPLGAEVVSLLIDYALAHAVQLNLYQDDVLYGHDSPDLKPARDIYMRRTGAVYRLTDLRRFKNCTSCKAIFIAPNEERDRLYGEFSSTLKARATLARTDPEYLEFTAPGVHKGVSLQALARHYGLDLARIMAIGNGDNDVDMVAAAGYGVAVQNATDAVKQAAGYVTRARAGDGAVAEIVQQLLLD